MAQPQRVGRFGEAREIARVEAAPAIGDLDGHGAVVQLAAHDDGLVGPGRLVRLDGIGAGLGDRQLEVVETGTAQVGGEGADRRVDHEADQRQVSRSGWDLQLDDGHDITP